MKQTKTDIDDKCTCGSYPDPYWTDDDWKRKEEAVKKCPIHKNKIIKIESEYSTKTDIKEKRLFIQISHLINNSIHWASGLTNAEQLTEKIMDKVKKNIGEMPIHRDSSVEYSQALNDVLKRLEQYDQD